MAESSRGLI